jgi:N-acetylneuraminic acid mutarotase
VNGKIYVIGGAPNWEDVALDLVQEYDPITGIWTEKSPMKRGRRSFSACTANGKIYVSGGVTACLRYGCCLSFVEEYDPATDFWTSIPSMSIPRHSHSSCVLNGKIYAIGGEIPFGVQGYSTTIDSVEAYDLETGNWESVASLPCPLYGHSCSVVDGKIYVVGGANKYTPNFMYDPDADTWIQKAEITIGRFYHYTEVINKNIYAITGFDSTGRALTSVVAYTP